MCPLFYVRFLPTIQINFCMFSYPHMIPSYYWNTFSSSLLHSFQMFDIQSRISSISLLSSLMSTKTVFYTFITHHIDSILTNSNFYLYFYIDYLWITIEIKYWKITFICNPILVSSSWRTILHTWCIPILSYNIN